ncbi:cholesterol side-chain cleavage enzyme, mitochondrial-like [Ptychodera flava]|uniref:cholesterol side-chain cleavage enzyme, mitochondrial-like n=1 Tax=Ptychodera flava TaxID=63121 RepID=UPI00396A0734
MWSTVRVLRRPILRQQGLRRLSNAPQVEGTTKDNAEIDTEEAIKPFDAIPGRPQGLREFIRMFIKLKQGALRKPWEIVEEDRALFGPIYKSGFGVYKVVSVFDPKDIETLLRHEGKHPYRPDLVPWLAYREYRGYPKGVLLLHGPEWLRNRSALNQRMLRPKVISGHAGTINEVVDDMIRRLKLKSSQGSDLVVNDLESDLFKYALDGAGSVLFDQRLRLLDDKLHPDAETFINSVHTVFKEFVSLVIVPPKLQKMLNTKSWRKHTEAWDFIFSHAKKLVEAKMEKVTKTLEKEDFEEGEADFITYLVSQGKISTEEIYANITEMLSAAIDTTSNALKWSLYEVARQPEVQERFYEEIKSVLSGREVPTADDIAKMPYLKGVVKETLRLYPACLSFTRILDHDIVIRGYRIPAKQPISCQTFIICRDPKIFEDPLKFKPERWLRTGKSDINVFASLPFGFGPRMCLGRRLAELELHLLLIRIIQTFRLESLNDVEPVFTTLVTPNEPLRLKFTQREL